MLIGAHAAGDAVHDDAEPPGRHAGLLFIFAADTPPFGGPHAIGLDFPVDYATAKADMPERKAFIRNIAEVKWREFPNHFGGALSKPLVMPETAGAKHIDYRISMYQPKAYVEKHSHKVQEQVYHVIEGEGLMHIDGKDHVVRRHDFIYLPPGVLHSIENTGTSDLVFLVVTSPITDDEKPQ
jgi:quercetin dioxygenase-like cupin family protein